MIRRHTLRQEARDLMALPPVPHWWPHRLGKRAVGMIGCAYIWWWLGIGNFNNAQTIRPGVLYLQLSPDVRGLLWIIPATAAVLTCLSRRLSPVGLGLLVIPALVVSASYGWSWVLYLHSGPAAGYEFAYVSGAIYLSCIGMVAFVASQPSPPTAIVAVEK